MVFTRKLKADWNAASDKLIHAHAPLTEWTRLKFIVGNTGYVNCHSSHLSLGKLLPNKIEIPKRSTMFAATVSKVAPKVQPLAVQTTRNMSVLSGPPQVKVSTMEQILHGAALSVGILAIPAWVLVNIKNYRGHAE